MAATHEADDPATSAARQILRQDPFFAKRMWQGDFVERLRAAGIGQAQAMAWYYERYGLKGGAVTGMCPLCAADELMTGRESMRKGNMNVNSVREWRDAIIQQRKRELLTFTEGFLLDLCEDWLEKYGENGTPVEPDKPLPIK